MTIYHFCSAKAVKAIRRQGIRIGAVYVPKPGDAKSVELYHGYQWLTLDPERKNQSWATRKIVKENRTAYRLTINLPDDCVLFDRDGLEKEIPGTGILFDGWPGSENWRVYHGWILPEWITACEKMEV